MKVAVLLATYNGEKYLVAQLDSLLNQTYDNFLVYYHDDGSTDSTLSILHQYECDFPGKFKEVDAPLHQGPKENFMSLLQAVDADYYMFCDQDDVWNSDKIEKTLERMLSIEEECPSKPVLIHTDLEVVDSNLNTIHDSFWKWKRFHVDISKHFNFMPQGHIVTGCTVMINNSCKEYALPISPNAMMHDEWLGLIAAKYGRCENLKYASMKYRQHENNVCSAGGNVGKSRYIRWWIDFYSWYRLQRPLLDDIEYGSGFKFLLYKVLYSFVRLV